MICGSMTFVNEMVKAKEELEDLGHKIFLPCDTDECMKNPNLIDDLNADYKHLTENNILKKCFKLVADSNAILLLNYPKNGTDGYIGTSSLMELGIAYHLGKKLFLLHDIPDPNDARWAHEVRVMRPIILKGDISKIE